MNIRQLLDFAMHKLGGGSSSRFDAEILLGYALEVKRSFLYANPELEVPLKRRSRYLGMIKRRVQGLPVAYLTESRSFWSLELRVTPDVLIPRPETELLVETALEIIPRTASLRVADLGTGSGAIALSLASERPNCEIHATDCSEPALKIAKHNAVQNQISSVHFHLGSWAEPLDGVFDLIVSNPPYVAGNDPHLTEGDCRFEPVIALSPGLDGLASFQCITSQVKPILSHDGWLLFEHGFEQGETVRSILGKAGYDKIKTLCDLAGLERVSMGKRPNKAG